jgi:hypothetical protein
MKTLTLFVFSILFACSFLVQAQPTEPPTPQVLVMSFDAAACQQFQQATNEPCVQHIEIEVFGLPFVYPAVRIEYSYRDSDGALRAGVVIVPRDAQGNAAYGVIVQNFTDAHATVSALSDGPRLN